jgi:hypothetical protein
VYTFPPTVCAIAIRTKIDDTAKAPPVESEWMKNRTTSLVLILVALGSLLMPSHAQAQSAWKSEGTQEFAQVGRGRWALRGRIQQPIGKATLREVASQGRIDFLLENGSRRRLEGTIASRDESGLRIKITGSGEASASGYFQVETAKNAIRSAFGAGKLDGQAFFFQFTDKRPLRLNTLSEGAGTWSAKNGATVAISALGLIADSRMRTELVFFLAENKLRRVSGVVKSKDEATGTYVIALKHSGMADAGGQIKIRLTAKNNMIRADGDATLDSQPIRILFEARIDAKIRASILEADAARMRTVSGERTMGNAATKYTAHADESGVRYIEAELNQADYGASHRKMYFEKGKLFYFSEQGQIRSTLAKASGQMNLVELALAFTPEGKVQAASKIVNGKAGKLGPHDLSGATSYAEALRKAAEEKLAGK